ncbi:MAG: pilus assembly protein TadB [Rhodospirillaceae bacterium]|nr:pilus assembly protein TadB [Magnetovibrio sp.]MAY66797.1 pilus assembly protein TadB [Rhodospirillaceae bacterium]
MEILLISLGVFTTILTGWVGLGAGRTSRSRILARRLAAVGPAKGGPGAEGDAVTLRRDNGAGRGFEKSLGRLLPRVDSLRKRLARTGKNLSVTGYLIVSVGLAAAVFAVLYLVLHLHPGMSVLSALAAGLLLPHMVVSMMATRRQNRFNNLFPDAIDLMVRGLRSGLPVTECIKAVGREMADPVGIEFRRVTDEVRFGAKINEALWAAAHRLDMPEFKFFVVSLSVQQETGGNLAETLANLSDILRRRRQMRLKIKAMSSEAKASAMILGSLPFIMFCIIYMMNPDYESLLFTDPRGQFILGAGLVTMAMGIFVMSRMVRFEI